MLKFSNELNILNGSHILTCWVSQPDIGGVYQSGIICDYMNVLPVKDGSNTCAMGTVPVDMQTCGQ